MRDAASQLPQGFHFLRLPERVFGVAAPAHVELAGKKVGELAMRMDLSNVPRGAILGAVTQLRSVAVAGEDDQGTRRAHERLAARRLDSRVQLRRR